MVQEAHFIDTITAIVRGDVDACAAFRDQYQSLSLELARKMIPDADDDLLTEVAQRALQASIDELPDLRPEFFDSRNLFEGWLAVVCARYLHECTADFVAVQRARELLPNHMPDDPHFAFTVFYRPCDLIGGDYYDGVKIDDGVVVLLIADVMGHGAPAALLVSAVKCAFRMNAELGDSERILEAMNNALCNVLPETCFVVSSISRLAASPGTCLYSNAGMEQSIVFKQSEGSTFFLKLPSTPLGMFVEPEFQSKGFDLKPGDSVILLTDGVTDLRNRDGERFGQSKLVDTLQCALDKGIPASQALEKAIVSFAGSKEWEDDACFVIATAKY